MIANSIANFCASWRDRSFMLGAPFVDEVASLPRTLVLRLFGFYGLVSL